MRDILIALIVFGSIPFILKRPYIGILMWAWLSYMNPHRLAYGFAYNMPFAQVIAVVLFAAIFFNRKDLQKIPIDGLMTAWIFFFLWMTLTTFFAIYPDFAQDYYIRVLKIQLLTFLTLMLINTQEKINKLIWVIVFSIGFYSIKGGVFTIISGGGYRVWGPAGTFIEENNALALSTLMIIPLMYYLFSKEKNRWIRYGLLGCMFSSLVAVLGSQSRGAFISIISVAVFFWLKSKSKILTGFLIIFLAIAGLNFMPETWHDRMNTIQDYEEDQSAMGRINAWIYSINIANDRLLGGGFNSWSTNTYEIYSPDAELVVVAHSIYFNVLADHGWIGLILFILILMLAWKFLSDVISIASKNSIRKDQVMLAKMLQVSLIAYCSGGAFLSLSYFDLPWHIIALAFLLKHQVVNNTGLVKQQVRKENKGVAH
ncbi:putative O-glycosylation ligase, exosortase A system-associated [Neptunomonas qingdaonensis]|uniref:Probable O-glycosylation ligase, exosortase A-associated n=1 Tax=Neptunomonas qingdaonensis TaxID=1045558 RepID=A0A1I2MU69_9GAMM|nr:putative O-glycosylation ligase, exosortase A system-associated [Neptunomonas qingdaonensis]SFF95115.1 probable O-glycosylation ligase, exosortase A-associated [Neptunomonas qingdaonensis]